MRRGFNILVDCAGTATAISVLKGLKYQKKYEYRTVTIDVDKFVAGRYISDKFYTVPPAVNPDSLNVVLDICEKENIDLFVPIFDLWLPNLSKNKEKFSEIGTFILISELETIQTCFDKYNTYTFFVKNNIPTPETYTLDAIERFKPEELSFPMFIKPREGGRASLNAIKIENKNELLFYTRKSRNWIVQEYIDGMEYTLDCLNTLDGKDCIGVVPRKRIETKGGLSVKAEVVHDEELVYYGSKIGKKLRIIGPYNIQCFKDRDGNVYFTEINPRFAGTHAFTIVAGMNSIEYVLDMLNGIEPDPPKIKYGVKMVRFWNEIIVEEERCYIPWNY